MNVDKQEALFPATIMPDPDWWQALWPDPLKVVQDLGVTTGMSVLDLCCGDGYFTAAVAKQVENGEVFGLDLDEQMLAAAESACAGLRNCSFLQGDAMDLHQLLPKPVDYCLMANTFHGVPEQTALAREIARVLKPGGLFAVVNWHARSREETPVLGQARGPRTELRMTPEQVRTVVEPAGFRQVDVITLPPYHYGALFRLRG
ncbi:class I SAM-dependent methyltransferase [Acidithiobacillus sp. VAN18-1]|uniref:Class I SAM-dependent methyltransferase n=2 Tax=Acidithiobacillaceae TaxID=225058 RepID=A0AAE2YQA0_9PROT|nr:MULTISPECIES: class I SAM-dependent methyltransferase [Acidithiobacillaceae]MBU2763362.1 class I SAM-dependent methyltransferase [Acidithiobacillus caldus]MBU2771201.1 class I SAM-dependent methyltransferase [Acidithiobacillus caldus]MBU2788372.1 class I SAM-dependent methyltransferase [Igneacidithiobacillus copahuensis]MBU2796390.1 class I SAM-dependent methyltransferase [Acidithiobacillus sp. VAN18-2]